MHVSRDCTITYQYFFYQSCYCPEQHERAMYPGEFAHLWHDELHLHFVFGQVSSNVFAAMFTSEVRIPFDAR